MTYGEKLLDGRWQQKRLHIFHRDGYKCRECGTTNFLTVHHCYYVGKEPWECPDYLLLTVCNACHTKRQGCEKALHIAIAGILAHVPVEHIEKRGMELLGDIYPMEGKD